MRLFTRRANEYTKIYEPVLGKLIASNVAADTAILDGEILAYDEGGGLGGGGGGIIPFGSNRSVAEEEKEFYRQNPDCGSRPRRHMFYIVFDLLHVLGGDADGRAMDTLGKDLRLAQGDVTPWPLEHRRQLLNLILRPEKNRLEVVRHRVVRDHSKDKRAMQIQSFFQEAVDQGEEGLVVKDLESKYIIGEKSRSDGHWIKMKPEYSDQTSHIDCLIIGAYYGDGRRRSNLLSHFLVGVSDHTSLQQGKGKQSEPMDVTKTRWMTMGKVGTGYTLAELRILNEKLAPNVIPYTRPKDYKSRAAANAKGSSSSSASSAWPKWLAPWNMAVDDVPDVFVPPDKSFVLEIKCAELHKTNQFSANFTPRFPRCVNIRYDKNWWEAITAKELDELVRGGGNQHPMSKDGDGATLQGASMRRARKKKGKGKGSDNGGLHADGVMHGVVTRAEAVLGTRLHVHHRRAPEDHRFLGCLLQHASRDCCR